MGGRADCITGWVDPKHFLSIAINNKCVNYQIITMIIYILNKAI